MLFPRATAPTARSGWLTLAASRCGLRAGAGEVVGAYGSDDGAAGIVRQHQLLQVGRAFA